MPEITQETAKETRDFSPCRCDLNDVVKCTRCRNKHKIGDRLNKRSDPDYLIWDEVCPKCSCKSYYLIQKAQNELKA